MERGEEMAEIVDFEAAISRDAILINVDSSNFESDEDSYEFMDEICNLTDKFLVLPKGKTAIVTVEVLDDESAQEKLDSLTD